MFPPKLINLLTRFARHVTYHLDSLGRKENYERQISGSCQIEFSGSGKRLTAAVENRSVAVNTFSDASLLMMFSDVQILNRPLLVKMCWKRWEWQILHADKR